eukprot:Rhum_TRINITY_DN20714_c0_g1::Rhum_TRINITY_DN20714_c0_g1_i1::g.171915::m.171915
MVRRGDVGIACAALLAVWAAAGGSAACAVAAAASSVAACAKLLSLRRQRRLASVRQQTSGKTAVVIGAGAGGLGTAVKLRELGLSVTVLEKGGGVGGVWRVNTYPGSEADVVSDVYCFSFFPYDWSRKWALQGELLRYFEDMVAHFNLANSIVFSAEVTGAVWGRVHDGRTAWTVTAEVAERGGDTRVATYTADYVVCATGMLHKPRLPAFFHEYEEKQRENSNSDESFVGLQLHTSEWGSLQPEALRGKRMAVVGTGSSGIQTVCAMAGVCSIDVLQRSPPWVAPKVHPERSEFERALYRNSDLLRLAARLRWFLFYELAFKVIYDHTTRGGATLRRMVRRIFEKKMTEKFTCGNPENERRILPEYEVGCKRVCLHDDWVPTLERDDVTIVSDRIAGVTRTGLRTVDAEGVSTDRAYDVIVYATGYRSNIFVLPIEVVGEGSLKLSEYWEYERDASGREAVASKAYHGVGVPGFPNFFMVDGPVTNGVNSIIYSIECQLALVEEVVAHTVLNGHTAASPTRAAVDEQVRYSAQKILRHVVAHPSCGGDSNLNKRGIPNNWHSSIMSYWHATRTLHPSDWVFS